MASRLLLGSSAFKHLPDFPLWLSKGLGYGASSLFPRLPFQSKRWNLVGTSASFLRSQHHSLFCC